MISVFSIKDILKKAFSSDGHVKVARNLIWLTGDKIVRLCIGLVVNIIVARYLGPSQLGVINYALAFLTILTPISGLGLWESTVRDIIIKRHPAELLIGSVISIQFISGVATALIGYLAVLYMRPISNDAINAVLIISISLILKSTDAIKYWFEANVDAKSIVLIELPSFVLFSALKLLCVSSECSLQVFVWIYTLEIAFNSVGLLFIFNRNAIRLSKLGFSPFIAKQLLSQSLPLVVSGLAIAICLRADQVIVGICGGDVDAGIYGASVRISELWYFIPISLSNSIAPLLLRIREVDYEKYLIGLKKLYMVLVILCVSVATLMGFTSVYLVALLYGDKYTGVAPLLQVHIWIGLFIALGHLNQKVFLWDNSVRESMQNTVVGSVLTIVVVWFFFNEFGNEGAAFAVLVSQFLTNYLFPLLRNKTRPCIKLINAAILMRT